MSSGSPSAPAVESNAVAAAAGARPPHTTVVPSLPAAVAQAHVVSKRSASHQEAIDTFMDLTAGTLGGCAGIFAGQPLDTIKVRMQSAPTGVYRNALDCFLKTVRNEGFLALYKGMSSPLIGNAPLNAVAFGAQGNMKRLLQQWFPQSEDQVKGHVPSYSRIFAAGCWGGAMQCIVACPVELAKCRLQVQSEAGATNAAKEGGGMVYSGPWAVLRHSIRTHGLMNGAFRGWWSTLWRDAPSYGAWFASYEYVKYKLGPEQVYGEAYQSPKTSVLLFAGGCAGIATWVSTYPFDVVKSIVQTLPDSTPRKELTMRHIFVSRTKQHGWKYFLRGLGPTVLRAVPANSVTFAVYESALAWLKKQDA